MAGVRGRKPNVPTDTIISTVLASAEGVVTTADFGGKVTAKRLNDLADAGVLALRKATQPVAGEDGKNGRGRPRKVFSLSKKTKDRIRRQERKAAKASA